MESRNHILYSQNSRLITKINKKVCWDLIMTFDIKLKVIKQEGTCVAGHEIGDEVLIAFTKNKIEGKICLHALYSILPKVFAMAYGAEFPWLKDPDVSTHACPDAWNPLVYEVSRIKP